MFIPWNLGRGLRLPGPTGYGGSDTTGHWRLDGKNATHLPLLLLHLHLYSSHPAGAMPRQLQGVPHEGEHRPLGLDPDVAQEPAQMN